MVSLLVKETQINSISYFTLYRFNKTESCYCIVNKKQLNDINKTDITNFDVCRDKVYINNRVEIDKSYVDNLSTVHIKETNLDVEMSLSSEIDKSNPNYFKVLNELMKSDAEIYVLSMFYPMSKLVSVDNTDNLYIKVDVQNTYFRYVKAFTLNSDIIVKASSLKDKLRNSLINIIEEDVINGIKVFRICLSMLNLYDPTYPIIVKSIYKLDNLVEIYQMREFYQSLIKGVEVVKSFYDRKRNPYRYIPNKITSYLAVTVEHSAAKIKIASGGIDIVVSELKDTVPDCLAKRTIALLNQFGDNSYSESEKYYQKYYDILNELDFIIWKFRVVLKENMIISSKDYCSLFGNIKIKIGG